MRFGKYIASLPVFPGGVSELVGHDGAGHVGRVDVTVAGLSPRLSVVSIVIHETMTSPYVFTTDLTRVIDWALFVTNPDSFTGSASMFVPVDDGQVVAVYPDGYSVPDSAAIISYGVTPPYVVIPFEWGVNSDGFVLLSITGSFQVGKKITLRCLGV